MNQERFLHQLRLSARVFDYLRKIAPGTKQSARSQN